MEKTKFRQPMYNKSKIFVGFHYWGLLADQIILPNINEDMSEEIDINEQSTNLKDLKGIESYVGDILKETLLNGEERFYKIFEVEGGFAINAFQDDFYKPVEQIQFWTALSDMQTISWFKSSLEIIGNIHENTELLQND